jgi:hypothetical protein
MQYEKLIKRAYAAFNARDIDGALSTMQPDVHWPNGWEGGYVSGHDEVREYWTRQWQEINPTVEPVAFEERDNGSLAVTVHQNVKDLLGNASFEGKVMHVYTFENGLIKRMEIEMML